MITYVKGNLFSSPAQVLVNTVNTVGVMGKGIAKEFKAIYPDMFREYQTLCEDGRLHPGSLFLYRTPHKWILNFPTKRHWRQKSRVEDIKAGLQTFADQVMTFGVYTFAFPQLGCGNGELDWEADVRPLMERYLGPLPVDVYIHTYDQSMVPEHRDVRQMRAWLRSEPRSLAFTEFWSDIVRSAEASGIAYIHQIEGSLSEEGQESEQALTFVGDSGPVLLTRSNVFDLWQRLRATGLIGMSDIDDIPSSAKADVFSLLSSLDYVEETSFAQVGRGDTASISTSDLLGDSLTLGLRLVASKAPTGPESTELEVDPGSMQPWLNGMTATRLRHSSRNCPTAHV